MTQVVFGPETVRSQLEFQIEKAKNSKGYQHRHHHDRDWVLSHAIMLISKHGCQLKLSDKVSRDITKEMLHKLSFIRDHPFNYGEYMTIRILRTLVEWCRFNDRGHRFSSRRTLLALSLSMKQLRVINSYYQDQQNYVRAHLSPNASEAPADQVSTSSDHDIGTGASQDLRTPRRKVPTGEVRDGGSQGD